MTCSVHLLSQKNRKSAPMVTFDIFWPCGLPMHRGDLSPISKLQKCNQRRQETTVDQKPARHHDALAERPLNSHGPQFLPQLYPQMVNKPLKQWHFDLFLVPTFTTAKCKSDAGNGIEPTNDGHNFKQSWKTTILTCSPSHSPISSLQRIHQQSVLVSVTHFSPHIYLEILT